MHKQYSEISIIFSVLPSLTIAILWPIISII